LNYRLAMRGARNEKPDTEYSTVTLTRCSDYNEERIANCLRRQFELLGGLEKFVKRGDKVLLKPNFIAPKPRHCATQTDPAIIIEMAKLLKDYGARPFVADSPAWGNVFVCVKALKLDEALKKLSVPVRALSKPKNCYLSERNPKVGISSVAMEADAIINLPKFKTHQQLTATFAVKNMFGCVSGKKKAIWHFARGKNPSEFCALLLDVFGFLSPAVTIIDAVTVMDGGGPITGRARPLGYIIGGVDAIACEIVCCKLVNIEASSIAIIKTANRLGFGCSKAEKIKIIGDDFTVCTDFELPKPVPIRFSLLHICRSIAKQVVMLSSSGIKRLCGR
jgi:uncharacterized protein (DUF362 family)